MSEVRIPAQPFGIGENSSKLVFDCPTARAAEAPRGQRGTPDMRRRRKIVKMPALPLHHATPEHGTGPGSMPEETSTPHPTFPDKCEARRSGPQGERTDAGADRKSTRLNSSH